MLLVAIAAHLYGLSINVTDSMPIGLYHAERVRLPVAKGTIVQTCLPTDIAGVGRRQGYLLGGSCPGDAAPVLKIVAAAGGDKVELLGQHIRVNGRTLPGSGTLAKDGHGRRLARVARGTFTLTNGDLWLWTPNPASWDSRYYGAVREREVVGQDTLLLQFGAWKYGNLKS